MHPNSLKIMKALLTKYVATECRANCNLYDVGSYNVNGAYRSIVTELGFKSYTGLDIEAGPNVDIVVSANHEDWSLPQRKIVISGQCLEHTRFIWKWFEQVVNLTLPDGLIFVIAPWTWPEHRYPVDCWRILPDGMAALADWTGITLLEAGKSNADRGGRGMLGDTWGVFCRRSA